MYNFNKKISGSFDIAQTKAISEKNTELKPIHLLFGLAKNPSTKTSKIIKEDLKQIELLIEKLPSIKSDFDPSSLKPSSHLVAWLSAANSIVTQEGKEEISEDHLITSAPKEIIPFLSNLSFADNQSATDEEQPDFLVDLNQLAREGKLDPVIGRTTEIRSALEILGRRSKNNPILV